MKALILIAALLFPMMARAEFLDGHTLMRLLSGGQDSKNQGMGYVVGVHDATRGRNGHCAPTK